MSSAAQLKIRATYMRGGTSKGVFFRLEDLPEAAQRPGRARDRLLQRVLGSPDPYGVQIDGMGGASSSTSKCVILSRSQQPGHDVDYLYGQVAVDQDLVDWSGNCGNLSTAAGAFAIHAGFVQPRLQDGLCTVRIWQANIGKTIVAHVPVAGGQVQETGDFELDGVSFPAAEVVLEFLDPGAEGEGHGKATGPGSRDSSAGLFPTGQLVDELAVPSLGRLAATLITAGIPTIFIQAADIGLTGTELREQINASPELLARLEAIRTAGALRMGLITAPEQAAAHQHTPKLALVAPPADYRAASGRLIRAPEIDLLVRALSMGKLHHAMMGTASVAIATAAAVPGTLVHRAAGATVRPVLRFGHPSGVLRVGAEVRQSAGRWTVSKAVMSRSARILMEGWVRIPANSF